jgi:hypothetical protein
MTAEHSPLPTTHDTVLSTLLVGTVTLISELPRPDFHQSSSAKSNSSSPAARRFDLSIIGILLAIDLLCGFDEMIAPSSR